MKKITISLFVILLALPLVAAYDLTLVCPPNANPGDAVTCQVNLDVPSSGFGAQYVIYVDSNLLAGAVPLVDSTVNGVVASSAGASADSSPVDCASEPQTIIFSLGNPQAAGLVSNINFAIPLTATPGTTFGVGLNCLQAVDNTADQLQTITVGTGSCGDGTVDTGEVCDDGNVASGDGCSSACVVESGFDCPVTGGACRRISCGDGIIDAPETCDDDATSNGDGCDASCQVETGWTCTGQPSVCTFIGVVCGDGNVDTGEVCDDGNVASGDGCDASCKVEPGFDCPVTGGTCRRIACGDGIIDAPETCDDDATSNGDGCDASCQVETGWSCTGQPSVCTFTGSLCGNGQQDGAEVCDDGGLVNGDGCDASCVVETGWSCRGFPSLCLADLCGDGLIIGAETCDQGTADLPLTSGDGCDTSCQIEPNYNCVGAPSVCTTALVCNDGDNMVTGANAGCSCDAPLEQLGDYCSSLIFNVRNTLNNGIFNIGQKVSLVIGQLKIYFALLIP